MKIFKFRRVIQLLVLAVRIKAIYKDASLRPPQKTRFAGE